MVAVTIPATIPPLVDEISYGPVTDRIPTPPDAGIMTSLEKNAVPINLESLLTFNAV